MFAYDILPLLMETNYPVKLRGLDPDKYYKVKEINMMPSATSSLESDDMTFSGEYLMKIGLDLFTNKTYGSRVLEISVSTF